MNETATETPVTNHALAPSEREAIVKQIAEMESRKAAFISAAEREAAQRIGEFNGYIQALRDRLNPPAPPAEAKPPQ